MAPWIEADHFQVCDVPLPIDLIPTTTVTIIHTVLADLLTVRQPRRIMAIVGSPGSGKTMACRTFIHAYHQRAHAAPTPFVYHSLAEPVPLSSATGERRCGNDQDEGWGSPPHSGQERTALQPPHIVIIDSVHGAQRTDLMLLLKHHHRCRCHLVLIMTPAVLVTLPLPNMASIIHIPDLTPEECITVILPRIRLPHWRFDVGDSADRELGAWMFQMLTPLGVSFRKLWYWLHLADGSTDVFATPVIDAEVLEAALFVGMVPLRLWSAYGS